MGSSDADTEPKAEKPPSPAPEQTNAHVFPDWAAMQAYYGAGVALPPPYFNSAGTTGHPPHPYMWGPPPMMPPYGSPYAAMYPHGGIYPHPSLSLGSHGHGVPLSPAVAEAMVATQSKSTSTKDHGLKKKSKGSDGLAVSIGNVNNGSAAGSQSEEGTGGSSDGSDGNTEARGDQVQRKRRDVTPPGGKDGKVDPQDVCVLGGEANRKAPALELMVSSTGKRKTTAVTVPPTTDTAMPARDHLPSELWMKDERALKREKRKQSNRESARRSRLRKQAESEELAVKVESLNAENLALRSEMNRLTENSEKLRIENTALMERLKDAQSGQAEKNVSNKAEELIPVPVSTENFLSRVHNSDSVTLNHNLENGAHENSNSGSKLHQLLKSSPRTDAVAAG
ncbi:G-box-binding factor [Thalictrum thalictroides]|uniref:G-box-binding factor n=1 Tax=Thalictrum thalictroides TaxID=46969 RepID=A0A7J6V917_THATH|nr:G-box-binding factor [Thalictrum thalictroides]